MTSIRRRGEGLTWSLSPGHHDLLLHLLRDLDRAIDGPTDDPVVARLFPRMVEGDDNADAELRMLLAGDLLLRRHEAIRLLIAILERGMPRRAKVLVDLTEDEPAIMLAVLNDVRLGLGARVGAVAVEMRQLVDEDDHTTHAILEAMDLLAYFQMQLLEHIDPAAAAHEGPDWDDSDDDEPVRGDLGDLGDADSIDDSPGQP